MLDVNTLPNRKDRILKTMSFRRTSIEKERKKVEKMKSKQILVPNKQNVRRWRYRSGYTYLQRSWLSDQGKL